MLLLKGVEKRFGSIRALKSLDLEIQDGALFGLMGQNGAGKTTLLRVTAGLLRPDSGTVLIGGTDVLKEPAKARMKTGYVPDEFGIYENLTVMEYMEFFAEAFGLYGRRARVKSEELIRAVGLYDRSDFPVDALSRGMQQRLSIARAMIHDPSFLVLDEPTSGLDPGSRFSVRELLLELCTEGRTILISSHVLSELSEICTDIGILDRGSMKITGEVSSILSRIENSNPLRISVLNGEESALRILRNHPGVRSVTLQGKVFSLDFEGTEEDEAGLLYELIGNDIPVSGFMREPGSLESFFLKMTGTSEEKVILDDTEESDL